MPAYVIADVKITDPETYRRYVELVPATIAAFGGRYLARGGTVEVLDGDQQLNRMVILEFEDIERVHAWWNSEAYRGPRALREASAESTILLVEGLDQPSE